MGALLSTCASIASSVASYLRESYGWLTSCFQMTTTTHEENDRSLNFQQEIVLGDVWDESTTTLVQQAYKDGQTRSIPTDTMVTLQVTFINESPVHDVILCWISGEGELFHYYRIPPKGGSHLETTKSGDAFALFHVPTTGEQEEEDLEEGKVRRNQLCTADTVIAAYRPKTADSFEHHLVTIRNDDDVSNSTIQTGNLRGSNKKQKTGWTLQVSKKQQPPKPKITPIDTRQKIYEQCKYGLWTAYCEPGCWDMPREEEKKDNGDDNFYPLTAHQAFQADLEALTQRLPEHVRGPLSESTAIYMNQSHPYAEQIDNPVGCFHPGRYWLQEHQMNTDKCGQVEFYNVHNYNKHRRLWGTGGIILHELCHAYHNKHLPDGYNNQDILDCYEAAMKEGLYESVQYHCGVAGCDETTKQFEHKLKKAKHYACSNPQEYFAELSVAFLSSMAQDNNDKEGEEEEEKSAEEYTAEYNKWFPHNTIQVKEHDPRAYEMLQKLWGVSK